MNKFNGIFDRLGIGVSAICLIHCVMLPLLFTGFNMAGIGFGFDEVLEIITLVLALIVGGYAMHKGYRSHGKIAYTLIFISGILLLLQEEYCMDLELN